MKSTFMSTARIQSIDGLRGVVMMLMAVDHVRMYFGQGTWYAEPTNLATTTPLLFFTRWITHFCAPVFVFLAGTSAFLVGVKKESTRVLAWYLLTRGLWLIFVEIVVVNFAWTFDSTYSFIILQVIWAIGISMVILSALVFLPHSVILLIGLALVFGHNLLDGIRAQGDAPADLLWYALHQQQIVSVSSRLVNIVYPVLPWMGLMALGYVCGTLYKQGFSEEQRRRWLLTIGSGVTILFLVLRAFNLYGEPTQWTPPSSLIFTMMSFLNTTKYPPSLHFLLMTMGPALIFLSRCDLTRQKVTTPILVFGKVPFFFYIAHLYFIHTLAMLWLVFSGRDWHEYILSAAELRSGSLSSFGLSLSGVYLVWILVIIMLYPVCRWYQEQKANNPSMWWLRYL
jgi:uncharacterized membrane protein